ncbi:hypothetical protein LG651_02860 [Tamlana sp. 62-3]|uniref:Uncharacterized protein n=1 Tax=Neotamlana sargassicola TaxID=2883125 RepID=A0A9X1I4I5_9FLAO|nr:hypothetical protein [Tamlana sargassicola]MCB4807177.1 hypothetical protein [Tamlana sargassicola]
MSKNLIVLFFSVTLLCFIAAPTVLIILDDSADVSVIYNNFAEEEELSKIKLQCNNPHEETTRILALTSKIQTVYFSKKYPNPLVNLISPPPELG